jgi:hypothetical protein
MSFDVKEMAFKIIEAEQERMKTFKEKAEKERMIPFIEKLINNNEDMLLDNNDENIKILKALNITRKKNKFFYIDYKENNIEIAKRNGFEYLYIDHKSGLTNEIIESILKNAYCNISNSYVIINCSRILTKSNIDNLSYDILNYTDEDFKILFEKEIKWGNKLKNKEKFTQQEQLEYSLLKKNVITLLESLYNNKCKVLILSMCDSNLLKRIFEYYNIDTYIYKYCTPDIYNISKKNMNETIENILIYIDNYIK